jgi:hypothetical protein
MSNFKEGQHVAHAAIESESGAAYAGKVVGVVGNLDDPSRLVILRTENQALEAYDERELVLLHGRLSFGPVFLKPRQFIRWFLSKLLRITHRL